jgi:hypothetical protein
MKFHTMSPTEKKTAESDWKQYVSLEKCLPITSKSGFILDTISPICPRCETELANDLTRGTVITHSNDVKELRAMGICCNTVTRYLFRVRPNGVLETFNDDTWYQINTMDEKPVWWDIYSRLKMFFNRD